MNGCGCKNCPVKPFETMNYRGSACAAQRAKFGLGDPMTNTDRIRAMTDDELNDLFREIYNAGIEDAVAYEWGQRTNSFEWTMEWLQQPAEGD